MAQEIGSCFWLDRFEQVGLGGEEISLSHLNIEIADAALLSTGRSAISYVLEHITNGDRRRVALLPPFTCYTVIEPFLRAGYQVIYYRIAEDLSLSTDSLREDIDKYHPSVLLVHGYFGFDTLRNAQDLLVDIRDAGTILVEDVTHTMYSEFAHVHADYYVGSFRKWAPLPDGGVAVSTKDKFSYKPMTSDNELQEAKLQAFHAKHLYMDHDTGNKTEFLRKYREAEDILCAQTGCFAMAAVSKTVQATLDIHCLRRRRRINYTALAEGLRGLDIVKPLFESLSDEVTPLYFPIYVGADRGSFQKYLAVHDVYAPVVWPRSSYCQRVACEVSNRLYEQGLCLPCDQRYCAGDMRRIVQVIKSYMEEM